MNGLQAWAAQMANAQREADERAAGYVHPYVDAVLGRAAGAPVSLASRMLTINQARIAAQKHDLHCIEFWRDGKYEFRRGPYGPPLTKDEKSQWRVIR